MAQSLGWGQPAYRGLEAGYALGMAQVPDPDKELMAGCRAFLVVAFGGLVLVVAPFLVFLDVHRVVDLAKAMAFGMIPALLLGVWFARRVGAVGAMGLIASSLAAAVFLFLRIGQVAMSAQAQQTPPLEYPESFRWLVPVAWILVSCFVAAAVPGRESRAP